MKQHPTPSCSRRSIEKHIDIVTARAQLTSRVAWLSTVRYWRKAQVRISRNCALATATKAHLDAHLLRLRELRDPGLTERGQKADFGAASVRRVPTALHRPRTSSVATQLRARPRQPAAADAPYPPVAAIRDRHQAFDVGP